MRKRSLIVVSGLCILFILVELFLHPSAALACKWRLNNSLNLQDKIIAHEALAHQGPLGRSLARNYTRKKLQTNAALGYLFTSNQEQWRNCTIEDAVQVFGREADEHSKGGAYKWKFKGGAGRVDVYAFSVTTASGANGISIGGPVNQWIERSEGE